VFELWASTKRRPANGWLLLDALQFGAPPHGGIALATSLDHALRRLDNIRDCIAFRRPEGGFMMTERWHGRRSNPRIVVKLNTP
jgi:aspartyl-tRNA synthetase